MRGRSVVRVSLVAILALAATGCDDLGALSPTPPPPRQRTATPMPAPGSTVPAATPRCAPPFAPPPLTADSVRCADPAGMQRATVTHIVDGDTLDVVIDGREERVRLFGADTAERGEDCFREATLRLEHLAGTEVLLAPDARDRDRYGRLLRYVYRPDGLSIDAQLIADGLATAWRDDGRLRFALIELEERARNDRRGCIWNR
jgi:endonuclease YncB( thermonuclease family)